MHFFYFTIGFTGLNHCIVGVIEVSCGALENPYFING